MGLVPNAVATGVADGLLSLADANTGAKLPPTEVSNLIPVGIRAPRLALWQSLPDTVERTLVGDAVAPGIIQAAVFSGHRLARAFSAAKPNTEQVLRERPVLM